MLLTYRISFPFDKKEWTNQEIADFVFPEFWLSKSEYHVLDGHIEGYPSMVSWFITPIRISVSRITVDIDKEINQINIRFHLSRMLITIFPVLIMGLGFLAESIIAGLGILLMLIIFPFLPTLIQIEFGKMDLKRKIKTLTNNG